MAGLGMVLLLIWKLFVIGDKNSDYKDSEDDYD